MGFMKEIYSNNRAGLLVTFGGDQATENYTPTDSVQEALTYFNLYVKDNSIYSYTETEEIYDELGVTNTAEVEELRTSINALVASMSDETAAEHPILFKEWKAGVAYEVGDRVRYLQGLFKVLQAHTSQENWTPTLATSLFAKILNPDPSIIPDWIQPDSTNGYSNGDKVNYNGQVWVSTTDNNVWEPGTTGAPWKIDGEEVEPEITIPEWTSGTLYNTGDRVIFNEETYESTIDNNVWSPTDYPTGWQLISE